MIFQNILIFVLVSLAVIFLGVMFSDGECVLQLLCLCEKNESLTFKECIAQLLGVSEENKNKTLTFLGIGMGGILLALQAVIANRRAKAMEKQAKAQTDSVEVQTEAVREQAKANQTTERGRRQSRLKDAIDHLGDDSKSVRLGSAHELFQLAQDTPDFRVTVLSILCAYIRQTAGEDEYRKKYPSKPSEEIQSLLTLLFVQPHKVFKGLQIDLQGSWLRGANLSGARLKKAILNRADLQEAHLNEARLQGAFLSEAHLQGAFLRMARLQGVHLDEVHLQEAHLNEARLQGADLRMAHLQGADLREAYLQGASLRMVRLQGADLSEARLQGANLSGAQLQGADLGRAQLQGVTSTIPLNGGTFADRINESIGKGKEEDFPGVTFAGGLSREDVDSLVKDLSGEKAEQLRNKLEPHIDKQPRHQPEEGSGAVTGTYTAEEAEQWLAEYQDEVEG